MKITANKRTLIDSLSRIQGIVEKTSIKPITSNVLIDATKDSIYVYATDLKIGIKAKYSDVKVIEEGKISINAKKLYEIIKEMPEREISLFEKENYWIEITCGKEVSFNIMGLPPEDFPMFIKENKDNYVEWETKKVLNMLDLTLFSMSRDDTKININGAYIENIEGKKTRMVTTDGYRLSIVDENLKETLPLDEGLIISYKAINELNRILLEKREEKKLYIMLNKNSILMKIGEVEFFVRLIEKKFPDYKTIIPGEGYNKVEVKIQKDKTKPTLKRISIISSENNKPVVFSFKGDVLEVFTEDSELGNVKETLKLEEKVKEDFSFRINCTYLLDILNAVDDDVIIEFNKDEENRPIIVRPVTKKENVKFIIMPMVM